jgi:dihydrodipicolinate synthase/N-acetylneuraminate lyase
MRWGTRQGDRQCRHACDFRNAKACTPRERIGVDGIAVITSFFIARTQDDLIRHFSTVADAVTTPVYLYVSRLAHRRNYRQC